MNGLPVYALGFNCSIGPESMDKALSLLKKYWNKKIYVSPNAANPEIVNGSLVYPISSQQYALCMTKIVDRFPISIIGGCCGTNPDYIKTIKKYIGDKPLPKPEK